MMRINRIIFIPNCKIVSYKGVSSKYRQAFAGKVSDNFLEQLKPEPAQEQNLCKLNKQNESYLKIITGL